MEERRTVAEYRAELDQLRALRETNVRAQNEVKASLKNLQASYAQLDQQVLDLEQRNAEMAAEIRALESGA